MLRDDPKYHLRKRLCVTGKTKVLFVEEERKTKHNKQSKIISDMKVTVHSFIPLGERYMKWVKFCIS